MSWARKRADRIKEEIPISSVLHYYGYPLIPEDFREQSFSCNLHGDGRDTRPSAMSYPDSNSWHCFGCEQTRDAISTVMEIEEVEFAAACRVLEQRYNLPAFEFDGPRPASVGEEIQELIRQDKTYEDGLRRTDAYLLDCTQSRMLPMKILVTVWELRDQIAWKVQQEEMAEREGMISLAKIRSRVAKRIRGE